MSPNFFRNFLLRLVGLLFSISCVTTFENGQQESSFDGFFNFFGNKNATVWHLAEFEPLRFLNMPAGPKLLAPAPLTSVEKIVLEDLPEVLNQGNLPAGPVFAAGYLATTYLNRPKMKSYQCSPSFLFRMLNGSEKKAIELVEVLQFLKSSGCARLSFIPYKTTGDYGDQPDRLSVRDAQKFRSQGYAKVDLNDTDQIKNQLMAGRVIITSLVLPQNFVTTTDSVYNQPEGDVMGRQTFGIIGFDSKTNQVWLQNSMGTKWGNDGRIWMPLAWYLRLVVDAYVIY
ncbi:MAG: C1 family peptidase [Leptonema sp. (in: Bacteria)]|nr:C1 family peptidase [Leptonema sp. (in: bacteria)]